MSDIFTLAIGFAMGCLWATKKEYIQALASRFFTSKKKQ